MCHWGWGDIQRTDTATGWLKEMGYHDFSGSGIVHLLGGTVAAVGCIFIGPRKGRFSDDGSVVSIPGHSLPLSFIGGIMLIFGFLAFNAGAEVNLICLSKWYNRENIAHHNRASEKYT